MTTSILSGFINNVALLLVLGLLYDALFIEEPAHAPRNEVLIGIVLGLLGIGVMMNGWELRPGVMFDTRSVLLSVTGFFFGPIPTAIAIVITSGYRLSIGGPGVWMGIGVIVTSGLMGLAWRQGRKAEDASASPLSLYGLGVVTHLFVLLWMLALPRAIAVRAAATISLPMMLIFPFTTLLLGALMLNRRKRIGTIKALKESEAEYRNIFENAVEGFYQSTPEGRFIKVNPAFARMLGYPSPEAMTADDFDIRSDLYANPDDRERWERLLDENGFVNNFEFEAKRKDGSHAWLSDSTRAILDRRGKMIRYEGNLDDITERKRSEQAIRDLNERIRLATDSAGIGVWDLDLASDRLIWDEWMHRLYGTTPDTFEGTSEAWRNRLHPDDVPRANSDVHNALSGKAPFDTKFRIVRPDGEVRHIKAHARVVVDGSGTPVKMTGVNFDITTREQAEARQRKLEAQLVKRNQFIETILDNLPIGLAVNYIDEGTPTYFNRKFEEIYGWPKAEINDTDDFFEKVYPDASYRAKVKQQVMADIHSGDPARMVWEGFEATGKAGQKRIIAAKNIPLPEQNLMISTVQDITERQTLQVRLQQAQKMEAIGNLAGGIAHDFNNILTPIIGYTELLLDGFPPDSPAHDHFQEILAAGRRGSDLVSQILAFSRQTEYRRMPVRVQQILREVLKLTRSTIPSDITIKQAIQHDCGKVLADPTQLHQIAMNLITNAYHAVGAAGGSITVGLREVDLKAGETSEQLPEPGRYVVLSVADTGCGIDPANLDRIFDPYFTTKAQGKGTGLGLAVVYGIIHEYGGEIKVASTLGQGTTFTIYIPLATETFDPADARVSEKSAGGTERILFVDDEAAIVRLHEQMLDRLGYRVTTRTSSIEALAAFKAHPDAFDLVITDMAMPNMTGDRLARELKSIDPHIPVIICTGFSERINKERAEAAGINGFLMKPVVKSKLAKMIRDVLDNLSAERPAE